MYVCETDLMRLVITMFVLRTAGRHTDRKIGLALADPFHCISVFLFSH